MHSTVKACYWEGANMIRNVFYYITLKKQHEKITKMKELRGSFKKYIDFRHDFFLDVVLH